MKKVYQVAYGQGMDSVLFSVSMNKFFSFETESASLADWYTVNQYYTSRSGLSGAGTIPADGDLIPFGVYRSDSAGMQRKEQVHEVNGQPIFGYAPVISHHGIDCAAPFVLTDGRKVAFVHGSDVKETLLHWGEVEVTKEISVTWYGSWGGKTEEKFFLCNPHRFGGVDALRFVDLRQARTQFQECERERRLLCESLFERTLNLWRSDSVRGPVYHLSRLGYLDKVWEYHPSTLSGEEIVEGWFGTGDGLYYRRRRSDVQAFLEVSRKSISEGKYVLEGETPEYVDFEQNFSVLEWYSRSQEEWRDFFVTKATKKARQDFVYIRTRTGVDTKRLMETNLEVEICLQDSYDTGNCEVGTANFISQFNIKVSDRGCITVAELLKNPGIEAMLKNFDFQKVINHKLIV